MTTKPSHKAAALTALDAAHAKVSEHPPGLAKRYLLADLETARDEVVALEELKRPRSKAKAAQVGG